MSDRRSFITGLALVPVALSAPALAANSHRPAWDAAISAERKAWEAMEAFHAANVQPANLAHDAGVGSFDAVVDAEEAWSPYTSAHADAVNTVLMTASPDWAAVAQKLEMGLTDYAFDGSAKSETMLKIILADVRRLSA